jgi:hypothetical protein
VKELTGRVLVEEWQVEQIQVLAVAVVAWVLLAVLEDLVI